MLNSRGERAQKAIQLTKGGGHDIGTGVGKEKKWGYGEK